MKNGFKENTVLYRRIKSAFPKFQVFIKELEMRKKKEKKNMKVGYTVRVFAIKDGMSLVQCF